MAGARSIDACRRAELIPRPESGAEQVGALDPLVSDDAAEMLLDDVRLALLYTDEAVGDEDAIADKVRTRAHEVDRRGVTEPSGDQRRSRLGTGPLLEAGREQRA